MKTIVGVLRGGPSHEHDVSLATGNTILKNIPSESFTVRDIFIDKQGIWYLMGRPMQPSRVLEMIDVAIVGLHGEYGEDGGIQKILELHGIPYSGSNFFASFLAMHKAISKEFARDNGLYTPKYILIESPNDINQRVREAVQLFIPPVVIKPVQLGSSVGVSLVTGYTALKAAVESLFADGAKNILLEEYIRGREATVGVIEHFRNEELYTLPPTEIIIDNNDGFFSYNTKKSAGGIKMSCPASFSSAQKNNLTQAAMTMHHVLGMRHYSSSDFIVTPKHIYYLETNSLPGLTEQSVFPKMLEAVGASKSDFLEHLIKLSIDRSQLY